MVKDILIAEDDNHMVESLTEDDIVAAEEAESICQASQAQDAQQQAVEAQKKAKEELDKTMQKLAAIPEDIIDGLVKTIEKLMKIINGYENPAMPDFDPSVTITEIENLLNPVISALSSLPVPSIPGLSDISGLLSALSAMKPTEKPKNDFKRPEIPEAMLETLKSLLIAIQSLCIALPLTLINVIFQMLDTIVGLFKQIAGVIGVPSIPFPLSLVPQCISMVPDIMEFVINAPGKINTVVSGKLKQMYKQIQDMQIPDAPDSVQMPQGLPKDPDHQG